MEVGRAVQSGRKQKMTFEQSALLPGQAEDFFGFHEAETIKYHRGAANAFRAFLYYYNSLTVALKQRAWKKRTILRIIFQDGPARDSFQTD